MLVLTPNDYGLISSRLLSNDMIHSDNPIISIYLSRKLSIADYDSIISCLLLGEIFVDLFLLPCPY